MYNIFLNIYIYIYSLIVIKLRIHLILTSFVATVSLHLVQNSCFFKYLSVIPQISTLYNHQTIHRQLSDLSVTFEIVQLPYLNLMPHLKGCIIAFYSNCFLNVFNYI